MSFGFPRKLIDTLECICGKADFSIAGDNHSEVIENGSLVCEECRRAFNIENGILHFYPEQSKIDVNPETATEMTVRDRQAAEYDRRLEGRFNREVVPTLKKIGDVRGNHIVEYGAGTGRITMKLLDAESLLAIDVSRDSLFVLREKIEQLGKRNVGLVWADIANLRLAKGVFDTAVSVQVYEHIPTFAGRIKFLLSVKRSLKNGGSFIFSFYHFDLRRRLLKLSREGHHDSGIYFKYFGKVEAAEEVGRVFGKVDAKPIDISMPVLSRLSRILRAEAMFSSFLGMIPFARERAHLILLKAHNDEEGVLTHTSYFVYPFIKKYWFWFCEPFELRRTGMVNFFSYNLAQMDGFSVSRGLTTAINLDEPLDVIWQRAREKFIRKQIEKGRRNGITIEYKCNFRKFKSVYNQFRKSSGLHKDRISIFFKRSFVFCAKYNNEIVSIGLFIGDGENIRAYALASLRDSREGQFREIVGQANRLIIWEAICFAKKTGHKLFDLGGISPDSEKINLRSLAEFKEAFGGRRVENYYYHKIYSPVLKAWMKIRNL